MYAYDEVYLDGAMKNLGEAFDYAVNACTLEADEFMSLFIATGFASDFSKGNPRLVSGLSGTELVMETLSKTGRSFRNIHKNISINEILKLYPTLHEASEDKFVDTINAIIHRRSRISRLQMYRKNCGLSQKKLAEKSGVNLRTLQQYELKTKDIDKASTRTVFALAAVLGCQAEDLREFQSFH